LQIILSNYLEQLVINAQFTQNQIHIFLLESYYLDFPKINL
jgi:hypothetical protein